MGFNFNVELDDISLQTLYSWIDSIPLSRRKKSLTRDFSDGLLVAEIVKHYFPKYVELHNYPSVNAMDLKLINWNTLNKRVLSKISYRLPPDVIKQLVESSSDVVQIFLLGLLQKIKDHLQKIGKSEEEFYFGSSQQSVDSLQDAGTSSSVFNYPPRPSVVTFKNPAPLSKLNILSLDSDTRMLLEEKEEAWEILQSAVKNLQLKVHRLENLLHLKDLRLQDLQQRLSKQNAVTSTNSEPRFHFFSQ